MFAIPRLTPSTAAKWIGSMPTLVTMGRRSGAERSSPLMSSMTMPMRIMTTLTISRITIGFSDTANTRLLASPGMSSKMRKRLTMRTMKTITITTPMVTDDSRMLSQKFPRFSPL